MSELLVKYYSARMTTTLDMNQFFLSVFEKFGEYRISFVPMTARERTQASTDIGGIEVVQERFWLFQRTHGELVRQRDLEKVIVHLGEK